MSSIRQGTHELFEDFVSRLMQTSNRLTGDTEAGLLIVKQLAFENANAIYKAALRPFRKKSIVTNYIQICSDIDHLYTQGLTIAAALQGKTVNDVPFQQRHQGPGTERSTGSPGTALGVVSWGITSGNVLIGE